MNYEKGKKKKPWKFPAEWYGHQISNKRSKHFKAEEPLPLLPLVLLALYTVFQISATGFV